MTDWEMLREGFEVTRRLRYFNHAGVSPLPRCCCDGMLEYLTRLSRYGAVDHFRVVARLLGDCRQAGADLLGTRPERIFFVRSTTQGLGIAATGLRVRPGDNVVLVQREFPANIRPWLPLARERVEVRQVPQRAGRVLLADLAAAVDARTAAISLSFVQFVSGFRVDVGAVADLAHTHDALLVVDAIQGLGAFPLPVERLGVDLVSADAHKWLLGPEGVGLGYCSPRALERIEPTLQGWLSVRRPFDFFDLDQPLRPDAARFEEGAYNLAGLGGMLASLKLLASVGPERVEARILELTDHLCAGLDELGWEVLSPRSDPDEKSGIVLCRPAADLDLASLVEALLAQRCVVVQRGDGLRISPHIYNTRAELDELLALLADAPALIAGGERLPGGWGPSSRLADIDALAAWSAVSGPVEGP